MINIVDLKKLRTAPILCEVEYRSIHKELKIIMRDADWFTVGIMAPSFQIGIKIIRRMEEKFKWQRMNIATPISKDGPVFLKANQNSQEIHIRIEYGLGKGILIGCHNNDNSDSSETLGPFPLDFFNS